MSACGRVPYPVGFGIGVVAVSGDHRSDFGLRFAFGLVRGIVWRPFCGLRDQWCIRFPLAGLSRKSPQVSPFRRCKFSRELTLLVRLSFVFAALFYKISSTLLTLVVVNRTLRNTAKSTHGLITPVKLLLLRY